jgi:hypothetical protein
VTDHEPGQGESNRRPRPGSGFRFDPRIFRLGVVTTVVVIASLLIAHVQLALLLPGAFAVAAAADALQPMSIDTEWLGWRRPVDRTRVLLSWRGYSWLSLGCRWLHMSSTTTYSCVVSARSQDARSQLRRAGEPVSSRYIPEYWPDGRSPCGVLACSSPSLLQSPNARAGSLTRWRQLFRSLD